MVTSHALGYGCAAGVPVTHPIHILSEVKKTSIHLLTIVKNVPIHDYFTHFTYSYTF